MPALPPSILEPLWDQFAALLPHRDDPHPLGCHRPRIPDRVIFDKLIQVLVFGCGYRRIADHTCSATTLRRRRDEWITLGVAEQLHRLVLGAFDRMLGLELNHLAVDGCITKTPCAARPPVQAPSTVPSRAANARSRRRPMASAGRGRAPASRRDEGLLAATLDTLAVLGPLPTKPAPTVHLDAGYDWKPCRDELAARGLVGRIARRGQPAPIQVGRRWVIERTHAWANNYGKLRWCTERRQRVVDFWLALTLAIITLGRLIRRAWTHYRWDSRPRRRP